MSWSWSRESPTDEEVVSDGVLAIIIGHNVIGPERALLLCAFKGVVIWSLAGGGRLCRPHR